MWYTLCINKEDAMRSRIAKWGNSLGLRIPKSFAEELGITDGAEVELKLEGGSLRLRPVDRRTESLEELLEQVTDANRHEEVDTGDATGGEVW